MAYDLSGLPLLEATVAQMLADQAATPSTFSGGAKFTASYTRIPTGISPGPTGTTSETVASVATRLQNIELMIAKLNR